MIDNSIRISSYFDNELSPEERIEFEKDLAVDKKLQNELNVYKRLSNQLVITKEDKKFAEQIKIALLAKRRKSIWRRRISYIFMPVVGLSLLFIVINSSLVKPSSIITSDDILNEYSIALTEFAE